MKSSFPINLPSNFKFGVATSAYQIEGGVLEGGRGTSIWDDFSHSSGATKNGDTGDIACDHYHRWRDDLDLMQEFGINHYRLNFSWVRLQPTGEGPLNPEGVKFYRDLLHGAKTRNIRPFVTLYHWDLPSALQAKGGWPERTTAEHFEAYVRLVVNEFSDLVDDWITINEPWCAAFLGYSWGLQAPGFRDEHLAIRAAHHLLLAHGLALRAIRSISPSAQVGLSNILSVSRPKSDSREDQEVANKLDIQMNQLFLNPLFKGEYGSAVELLFPALNEGTNSDDNHLVQSGDLAIISQPQDFIGVNHYHNMRVSFDENSNNHMKIEQEEPNHQSSWGWSNTPWALKEILLRLNADYSKLPIYITENGITLNDEVSLAGEISDDDRIDYLAGYISAVEGAISVGVPVKGYFVWSFLDNFEWAEGYDKRFGLVHVDYSTQKRTPKKSAYWYRDLIIGHKGS